MQRFDETPNLVTMFYDQVERLGDRPFLWRKIEDRYTPLSWAEVGRQVTAFARALIDIGLKRGDRVVVVSENRPEWLIADMAVMAAGGVTVPAYTTNTADDHHHILTNSGARGAIVSDRTLARNLLPAAHTAPDLDFLVSMERSVLRQDIGIELHAWDDLMARGQALEGDIRAAARHFSRDDTACIIYTSGTGGVPRGVVLHHGSILCNLAGAGAVVAQLGRKNHIFLSFLPLSHAYEHTGGQFLPIGIGAQIYYAEGVDALLRNIEETRPTLMTAVPRLYELMYERITRDLARRGGLRERLFSRAVALGRRQYEEPESLTLVERGENMLLTLLVRRTVHRRFGGRLAAFISGGAPLNYDVGVFFTALGLKLLQGYGQTEAGPVISVNPPSRVKINTVGLPLEDVDLKIDVDGEILVRGELVMKGYWRDPEATQAAIIDGWLHTGDVGVIDEDGYVEITDRKKDIIVNSGGDSISPQRVEGFLTLEPEIAQAMIYGDRRPHLVALIVPDPDHIQSWAETHGAEHDPEIIIRNAEFRRTIRDAVDRVNRNVGVVERIRRFALTAKPFTVENGMMTPTLKIRRHMIRELYEPVLQALYE